MLIFSSVRSSDELAETLTCFMYKNRCYAKVDFYTSLDVSATIEIHSPDEVPVRDSPVIQVTSSAEVTYVYKVTETL